MVAIGQQQSEFNELQPGFINLGRSSDSSEVRKFGDTHIQLSNGRDGHTLTVLDGPRPSRPLSVLLVGTRS
jgi:hypothetical protein